MGFDHIIALDLGKFKSVCFKDAATRKHRFDAVATTPAALHDLLAANAGPDPSRPDPSRTVVVFETCDGAGWVHDIGTALHGARHASEAREPPPGRREREEQCVWQ